RGAEAVGVRRAARAPERLGRADPAHAHQAGSPRRKDGERHDAAAPLPRAWSRSRLPAQLARSGVAPALGSVARRRALARRRLSWAGAYRLDALGAVAHPRDAGR